MSQRTQRVWLKKETRSQGRTWVLFFRASNKTLIPDVETTSGQSLNGIRAVRFLDQVEHGCRKCEVGNDLRRRVHAPQQVLEARVGA
jgi:hypothetical protein